MKRALVIGGSGMLADVSEWLEEIGYQVYVVGRSQQKMNQLLDRSKKIKPFYVDYQDVQAFSQKINQTFDWSLVVAWIHNVPENPLNVLIDEFTEQQSLTYRLYHVLGSSSDLNAIKANLTIPNNCIYHQVQLGFKTENGQSRWLTHNEISQGVIEAIQNEKKSHVVGQLEPWDQRP